MSQQVARRAFLKWSAAAAVSALVNEGAAGGQNVAPPNIVLIFTDDQGYGDLSCYGAESIRTPQIDSIAREGIRFTDFYVPQAVCSASRAGLLTGCYPNRIGILNALGPKSRVGISDGEMTLAQLLKQRKYATAIFGKWHLGDAAQFLPTRHGFDEYFGLPYSNDMWPNHPTDKSYPPLPLIEGEKIIAENPDQTQLTTWYTQRAVSFIERNKSGPFFLYLAHNMPHVPLFVSEKHKGKSAGGIYGDVIEEIDWSVGQILETLRKHNLEENTLVIFSCDNGPWLSYGRHAGSVGQLREGKATSFEGGVRVPCVMRLPGRIPRGSVCGQPVMSIDIFPTVAHLTGSALPAHAIDGKNIAGLLTEAAGAGPPHEALYFYWEKRLEAVRSGKWKLHFPHKYRSMAGRPLRGDGVPITYGNAKIELALFDLSKDPGEEKNVAGENPEVVERLKGMAEVARKELGDGEIKGAGVREPGRVPAPAK